MTAWPYSPNVCRQKIGLFRSTDRSIPCLTIALAVLNVNDICKTHGGKPMKSSEFSEGKLWGFQLARRVAKGHNWHPSNDDLRGTAKYGTPPTDPKSGPTGTMQWDYDQVQYFMFSTGDFSEWCVLRRLIARHLYQHQCQRAGLIMHFFCAVQDDCEERHHRCTFRWPQAEGDPVLQRQFDA